MDARKWLRENKYEDVAEKIEAVLSRWKKADKRTRRNWWDVLSGNSRGMSIRIEGVEFPVLKSAQIRQGRKVTANAICRSECEIPPVRVEQARWNR